MSDSILKALMQLFAIIANTDEVGVGGREIVERFLRRQILVLAVEAVEMVGAHKDKGRLLSEKFPL